MWTGTGADGSGCGSVSLLRWPAGHGVGHRSAGHSRDDGLAATASPARPSAGCGCCFSTPKWVLL